MDEWTTLKNTVSARHVEVEGQFKDMDGKEGNEDTENGDDYGGNKEQAALDANAEKVKEIRDSLVANNGDWREMIDTVSTDYEGLNAVKKQMVDTLTTSAAEMKQLLDLVIKIPKRKILNEVAGAGNEEEQQEERGDDEDPERAADNDNDNEDGQADNVEEEQPASEREE